MSPGGTSVHGAGMGSIGLAFIVFRFVRNSYFHVAFSILYFQSLGFSLSASLFLESVYYLAKAGFEVPSGLLADAIGRKAALVTGSVIAAACYFGMGNFDQYWQMVVFEIGLGLSMALASGADSALAFDEYQSRGQSEKYERVESIGWGMRNIARGVASAVGSVMASGYSMASTFVASALVVLASAAVAAFGLRETRRAKQSARSIAFSALSLIRTNADYRYLIVCFAITSVGIKVGFWAFQPFLNVHEIPLVWTGSCFTLLLGISLVASCAVEMICSTFGYLLTPALLVVASFLILCGSFAFSGFSGVALLALGLSIHAVAQGISDPVMRILVNRNAPSASRATAMSLASMAGDGSFAAAAPLFGYVVEQYGGAWASLGVAVFTGLFLISELQRSHRGKRR